MHCCGRRFEVKTSSIGIKNAMENALKKAKTYSTRTKNSKKKQTQKKLWMASTLTPGLARWWRRCSPSSAKIGCPKGCPMTLRECAGIFCHISKKQKRLRCTHIHGRHPAWHVYGAGQKLIRTLKKKNSFGFWKLAGASSSEPMGKQFPRGCKFCFGHNFR